MSDEPAESKVDILLVDDHPANLLALEAVLAGLGQNLVKAGSGEEALARLLEGDFAVVLLDVQMHGLDGFETARLIRERERSRHTPIIFVTAFDNDPVFSAEEAYSLGAVDYLVKPLVPRVLRAKVAGFIDLFRKTERATRAEAEARARLRDVLATVNDMFLTLDGELRYTSVNDRMVQASGLPREKIVGRRLREVFPDAADSLLERELLATLERKTPTRFESYHAAYDRWFENRAYPSGDGLILVATEITESKKAEEARRHLAAIVESSDDAIVSKNLDGIITSWNKGAERLLGYTAGEVIGQHISLLMPPDCIDDFRMILGKFRQGERVDHYETRRRRKDGTVIEVSLTVSPVRNAAGEIVGASKIARDISERKRAEKHHRLLADAGRILGSSLDYEATLANVCKLVVPDLADWCSLDLVSGAGELRCIDVVHKDPAMVELARELRRRYPPGPDDERGLMKVLRSGTPELIADVTDEMLIRGARGEEHLRILRGLGLRSVIIVPLAIMGRTLGALTLVTAESSRRFGAADLALANELASRAALAVENARLFTDAHEAIRVRDEALALHRGMEEQLTLLVEASGSLSASLDPPSVLSAVLALSRRLISADAYAVWRYRPASGRWGIELASGLSGEYQCSTIAVLGDAPSMPETPVISDDIHESPLLGERARAYDREGIRSLMAVPLRVQGSVIGTLVFYYRSPHRFSEIEIRVATALTNLAGSAIGTAEFYEELRDNDRRKDEFLAMLAHELRNPLSAISNAVHLARRTNVEADLDWATEVIERQSERLARLMDDLLDVSRITRGKITLKRDSLDARPILQSAIDAVRPLIDERKHELSVSVGAGPLRLVADGMRVEQILVNLLTNAAKYTANGGHIWVTAEQVDSEIIFRVRDDGIGIAAETLPRMFDLFAQGERSVARSEGGLGIGLTLVRKLTEMHGGSVSGQSQGPGNGSLFTVRLPASESVPAVDPSPAPASEKERRGSRILVVDDNLDTARSMAKLLKLLGHEVRTADDGPSGIEAARDYQPEIILLDIGLPGMSGYEVAAHLRRDDDFKETVIIAVSGYGQEEDRRRSQEAGFNHHLVKPVDHDALITLLSR